MLYNKKDSRFSELNLPYQKYKSDIGHSVHHESTISFYFIQFLQPNRII